MTPPRRTAALTAGLLAAITGTLWTYWTARERPLEARTRDRLR